MITLRPYQKEILEKGITVLKKHRFLYLAMEVRTGKTLTSLAMSLALPVRNLLFITKKKAISSIQQDYDMLDPSYQITIINYESLHKVSHETRWDMIVCDESHSMGAFPKPSLRAKTVKSLLQMHDPYVILLSGTPTPESYSQMYHQVYGIRTNPFRPYVNFYKFAKQYVNVTQKKIGALSINDYSNGLPTILDMMKPYTIAYSQKEAGFKVNTDEKVLNVPVSPIVKKLVRQLTKDRVVEGENNIILADTAVKLMSKLHQLYSGTVKFEGGQSMVIDLSKAEFIRKEFKNKKIAIFYKFKEELNALKKVFRKSLCTELEEFNSTNKSIALQIVSGREGISLKNAQALVYYNIDFSATSYWQSRDRMTTKNRLYNKIYWIFSEGGIENDIYRSVIKKKDYTLNHFKKDLLNL
jgi:hypothetical protein